MANKKFCIILILVILSVMCFLCACHEHEFDEWTVTVEPTCTQAGQRERLCECGEKQTETLSASGHTPGEWSFIDSPTCTVDGRKQQKCSVCEEVLEEETAQASGHSYKADKTPPTCLEQGYTTYNCSCGDSYESDYVDALGHDEVTHKAQNPTCTEAGWDAYVTCSRCDYNTYIEIPATNHVFENWQVTTDPTCTKEGQKEGTCLCGESDTQPVEVIPHPYVERVCPVCGDIDYSKGLDFELIKDGTEAVVKGIGSCQDTFIVIPEIFNNVHVTAIARTAFSGLDKIVSVRVPDSITTIEYAAFYQCKNLTTVKFGENSQLATIGEEAFAESGLTAITIPKSVTIIERQAFWRSNLQTLEFAEQSQLTTIQARAFVGCGFTNLTIPNSVTSIGISAFAGCTSLAKITLPFVGETLDGTTDNVDFGYVFYQGNSISDNKNDSVPTTLKTVVITNARTIAIEAFRGCKYIESVTLPSTLTKIDSYAFYDCTHLQEVTIPEGVTTIGPYAFGNTVLKKITIPNSVTKIYTGILKGCNFIQSVTLPFVGETADGTGNNHFGHIFGAKNYMENEKCVAVTLRTVVITGGTTIARGAFFGCNYLYNVTLPSTITTIDVCAFQGCAKLESIAIPSGVTTISNQLFSGCENLATIIIPSGVTTIGDYVFTNCISLVKIYYGGTEEQWSNITISDDVGNLNPDYVIYDSNNG